MKTEVVKEKYNQFLKRKELVIDIDNTAETTPSKASIQHLLAKEIGKDVEHIEILDIMPSHGMPRSTARVFVWDEKIAKDMAKKEAKEEKTEEVEQPKAEQVGKKSE